MNKTFFLFRNIFCKKAIAIFIFLFSVQGSFAATYYFSSSTGKDNCSAAQAESPLTPWKSINKLNTLSNLAPGDSILFKKGDGWVGTLVPNCNGLIFGSYGTGAAPVINGGASFAINISTSFESNLVFTGLVFKRTGSTGVVAQLGNIGFNTDVGITNCTIQGCSFLGSVIIQGSYNLFKNNIVNGATNDGNGNGIWEYSHQCNHNTYTGNTICYFTLRGIWTMIETNNCIFQDNIIHNCQLCGLDLDGAYHLVYEHSVVDNTIYNTAHDAIDLENAFSCTIKGNYMFNGGHSYIYIINYSQCELLNGYGSATGIGALLNSTLEGNVMNGGGVDYSSVAIGIYQAGGVNIINNTINGFVSRFLNLQYTSPSDVPRIRLVNNIFSNMATPSWYAMISFSTNDLNILAEDDHNCFFNNGISDIYSDYTTYKLLSLAQYQAATGKAGHSIVANPIFISAANLHLQSSSPCIDAGMNVGLPYAGNAPDIGAYESAPVDQGNKPVIVWRAN